MLNALNCTTSQRSRSFVVHFDRLQPYNGPPPIENWPLSAHATGHHAGQAATADPTAVPAVASATRDPAAAAA